MEYHHYNLDTLEYAFSCDYNKTGTTPTGYTNVPLPRNLQHGDAFPNYIEKAIYDAGADNWNIVPIGE